MKRLATIVLLAIVFVGALAHQHGPAPGRDAGCVACTIGQAPASPPSVPVVKAPRVLHVLEEEPPPAAPPLRLTPLAFAPKTSPPAAPR